MKTKTALSVLLLLFGFVSTAVSGSRDYRLCRDCHNGIEKMDENHDFACEKCHLVPEDRERFQHSHYSVQRFPSTPESVEIFCGDCHKKEISRVQNSLHYTLAGIIGQTRYLWGAQENAKPIYSPSAHSALTPLPAVSEDPKNPEDLVDNLLQSRCFSCHMGQVPSQSKGTYRGVGCTACHVYYADDGLYSGNDPAMKGRKGYPEKHAFSKPIPVKQCLHCHNGPRVGADFAGFFEHDYHHSFRTPWRGGSIPEPIYLMDHHRLSADIHFQKGMTCVDCHDQSDVMGTGKLAGWQQEAVGADCLDCHGRPANGGDKRFIADKRGTGMLFRDRRGRLHPLPGRVKSIPAHNIKEMQRLHCTSCHAGWGFYDYGLSLFRDDREDLSQWGAFHLQSDERIANIFDSAGQFIGSDGLPGPWFSGWRFRRWEYLTLGVDTKGRIVPFRPHYQYRVSFVNKKGEVIIDNQIPRRGDQSGPGWAYMPFYPHTIRSRGRSCEDCHGQSLAAGEGLGKNDGDDLMLTRPDPPVYPGLRLLEPDEKEKLIKETPKYRQIRSRILWQEMED
ncbi:hypothetical protein ACFL0O_06010 [Thermodesulfobacteriota bacterium]